MATFQIDTQSAFTGLNGRAFAPGDVVALKAGVTFTGSLTITADGSSSAPITFTRYGEGNNPVISTTSSRGITLSGANYVIVERVKVQGASYAGIEASGGSTYCTVRHCEVTNCGLCIVFTGGRGHRAFDNYVHDPKMVKNTVGGDDDYGANGFQVQNGATDVEIAYNKGVRCKASSYDYGLDGGFLEIWGAVSNLRVHHNVADDCDGFIEAGGNPLNASGVQVTDNLVINSGFHYIHNASGTTFGGTINGWVVENNTVVQNAAYKSTLVNFHTTPTATQLRHSRNIYTRADGKAVIKSKGAFHNDNAFHLLNGSDVYGDGTNSPLGTGEKIVDPQFVGNGDYTLKSTSPVLGWGIRGPVGPRAEVAPAPTPTPTPEPAPAPTPQPVTDLPAASISVSPSTVTEGGAANLIFTVSLDRSAPSAITVPYTISGTARPGDDYAPPPGTITLQAGESSASFVIDPIDDAIRGASTNVVVSLSPGAGYRLATVATGTINEDDV